MNLTAVHRALTISARPALSHQRSLHPLRAAQFAYIHRNTRNVHQKRSVHNDGSSKAEEPAAPSRPEAHPVTQASMQGSRDRAAVGVFTPTAAVLFVATGVGLYYYFEHEKKRLQEEKRKELENRKWGKAAVGGPFTLTTHTGKSFTEKDLLGKWNLVYFGFTNCPDICPDELDKMSGVVEDLDKLYGPVTQPVFISVDPARDPPHKMARYVRDFHGRLVGLTGTYEETKAVCRVYRVYFSTPRDAEAGGDYLVDHSIYFYLMDPRGEFVEAFGKASTREDVVARVVKEIGEWEAEHGSKT